MTMYVRTVGNVTITISDQFRDDDLVLNSRVPYTVLPLWAAQRASFQRLWLAEKVEVATDPNFNNLITEIPISELESIPRSRPVVLLNLDGDHVLTSNEEGAFIGVNASTSVTIIIPLNEDVSMNIGTQIEIARLTSMSVYVNAAQGVELIHAGSMQIAAPGRSVYLTKIDTNTWYMAGALGN